MPVEIPSLWDGMEASDYWRRLTDAARTEAEIREMDPSVALEFWCQWLAERIRRHYDAVVIITGDEGSGKSTLALRMILRVSEIQGLPWRPTEVCYSALDLVSAYRSITARKAKGWPVWYDEGVRGSSAYDNPLSPESKAIVKSLALVRESGAILFALYPSIWLAAKQIRARRACLWIHVVYRGLGRVHERDKRLNYLPTEALGLTISPQAPHIAWNPFAPNSAIWRAYLATKNEKLQEFLHETEQDLRVRSEARTPEDRAARQRAGIRRRVAAWRARQKGVGGNKDPEPEPSSDTEVG